jgi:hypothetical protein
MARRPRPWYRSDKTRPDKCGWYIHFGGKLRLLHRGSKSAADKAIAERRFHELMLMAVEAPEASHARVVALCEAYLEWSERRHAPDTYRCNQYYRSNVSIASGVIAAVHGAQPQVKTDGLAAILRPSVGRSSLPQKTCGLRSSRQKVCNYVFGCN